jgi:GNAT superfamily N-acetyltransferase
MQPSIVCIETQSKFAELLEERARDSVLDRGLPFSSIQPISISYHSTPPSTTETGPDATHHDQILGGLTGYIFGAYLQISLLWVSETLRGQGIGRALIQRAEYEAAQRGCTSTAVDTFGFQAEDFYVKKLGFRVLVRVPGAFERRSTKIYMSKGVQ